MKIKKFTLLWLVPVSLIVSLTLVLNSCNTRDEKVCCSGTGGITLDISSLPAGPLPAVFNVDNVTGNRIYNQVKRTGASLRCLGREEFPPGSGNWKDAAVMLLFSQLPCRVCTITFEVHGHDNEARIVATQRDGTTQTALCPGDRRVLALYAGRDNPFTWVILSGQEAEWLKIRLE